MFRCALPFLLASGSLFMIVESSKILALTPCNSRSHFVVMAPLYKRLAEQGHEITVVSPFPLKVPIKNYTDIDVSNIIQSFADGFTVDFIYENLKDPTNVMKVIWKIGYDACNSVYEDKRIQKLINTTEKYDLLITEIFSSDCFVPFAHKMNIPLVSIVTSVALPWASDRIGNPDNPSYIVNYFHSYDIYMSFSQRLINTVTLLISKVANYYVSDVTNQELVKKYFGDDIPQINDIYNKRTALVLVNSYYTVNQPRPFVPGFIEIGGIHLQKPSPLPQEFQTMLDGATDGFIFFSMGTLVKASSMDPLKLKALCDAFAELPQLVLWKYVGDLPFCPTNVIIRKWLPQKDILVHKNLKAFITHGGLSSTLEAINAGKPIIGIPMFADQEGNIMNVVRRGAGIHMSYDTITKDVVLDSLNKVINDKSYMENAIKLSDQFRDRPQKPLETAVFWIEHILRHKGGDHMRSPATDLPIYKLLLLDVVAFLCLSTVILAIVFFKLTKFAYNILINMFLNDKRSNLDSKKKKQ